MLMWNDKSLSNLFIFPNICSVIDRQHLCHLKTPCCDSWDIQGQSLSRGFKAFFCTTFSPGLGACICLATFSSLHLRLMPFLGSLIVLQLKYWSSKFWNSTVLDSAKQFGWSCVFCYIVLSTFIWQCISRRRLLHYSEGSVFVLR